MTDGNHIFLLVWALLGFYKSKLRPIRAESLTFGQTFQLRLEIELFSRNCT